VPEPVTTEELLLQRIADRLDSIDVKLGRGLPPEPTPPATPPAKKTAAKGKKPVAVDGR
jgi:hypothetical protein